MPEEVAILFALTIGSGTLLTLAWIVTRYLERKGGRTAVGDDSRVQGQLEEMRTRLEGVEERLEFAERLLAQQRERRPIEGGP